MSTVIPNCVLETCSQGQTVNLVKPGDFFLTHGDTFWCKLIELGQALRFKGENKHWSFWTHCGIFKDSSGNIIETLGNGVVERNITYYQNYKYIVVHLNISDEDRQEMVNFAKSCIKDGYGWLTLLSIGFSLLTGTKFSFGFDGEEICSGLVTRSLERTSFIPSRDASHITPADLAKAFGVA